jgi:hypothetical protein
MKRAVADSVPALGTASGLALLIAISLIAVRIIPPICRAVLAAYEGAGKVEAAAIGWIVRQLIRIAAIVLNRLQNSHLAAGNSDARPDEGSKL